MRVRKTILTLVILAVCLGVGWIALNWRAALAETRAQLESAAFSYQAQLDEKNRVIQQLQNEVQQARADALHTAAGFKAKAEALETQLTQQANLKSPAPTREQSGAASTRF